MSFTDPAGDSGTAADITKVDVQNDDANTAGLTIFFDTDQSASTGDPTWDGADYALSDDHGSHSFFLLTWNGTDWELKVMLHAFISAGGSKGSAAVCSFSVPKALKHKKVLATETVTYEGQKVTHTFTTTVK